MTLIHVVEDNVSNIIETLSENIVTKSCQEAKRSTPVNAYHDILFDPVPTVSSVNRDQSISQDQRGRAREPESPIVETPVHNNEEPLESVAPDHK